MNITRLTDYTINNIYEVDTKTILVDSDKWQIWKKVRSSWRLEGEVKKKDYKEYIKASLIQREKELVEFGTYGEPKVFLLTKDEIEAKEKKLISQEKKKEKERTLVDEKTEKDNQDRKDLSNTIHHVIKELDNLDVYSLTPQQINIHKVYLENILNNLNTGDIKDTKTTIEVNKINRLEEYKSQIYKYIKEGKYTSINQLSKDLKINRTTLYNLKLNDYITTIA